MSDEPKVSIVILNWNGEKDTISLLSSLTKILYSNYSIILIDNGSEGGSPMEIEDWLREGKYFSYEPDRQKLDEGLDCIGRGTKIIFLRSHVNLGFAKGCNLGIKYALDRGDSYVLLLNNDTEVLPDFLGKMMDKFKKYPHLGAVIPQIRYFFEKDLIWNCGGKIYFGFRSYFFSGLHYKRLPEITEMPVTFATGCALLFKPEETGYLTERFFFGEEDFEFSYRLKKNKITMLCAIDAIIYHKVGQSISRKNNSINKGTIFIYYLNRFINMRMFFNNRFIWSLWKAFYMIYIFGLLIANYRYRKTYYFLNALWHKSILLDGVNKQEFEYALARFS